MATRYKVYDGIIVILFVFLVCTGYAEERLVGILPSVKISADLHREKMKPFYGIDTIRGNKITPTKLDIYSTGSKKIDLFITVSANEVIDVNHMIIFQVKQMFTGKTKIVKVPVPCAVLPGQKATWSFSLIKEQISFDEGAYHILVDIERNGQSRSGNNTGSLFYYLADDGMSLGYVVGCYQVAFMDFLIDPENGTSINLIPAPGRLPTTLDPHNIATREEWIKTFLSPLINDEIFRKAHYTTKRDAKIPAELVADGGEGILFAMLAFRVMGDELRARFAHDIFDRFVCQRVWKGMLGHSEHQTWHVIRMISYACIMLHKDPQYGDWAKRTFEQLIPYAIKNTKGRLRRHLGDNDKVTDGCYTGRILGGRAFFQIAHFLYKGEFAVDPIGPVDFLIQFGVHESYWIKENDGYYITDKNIKADDTYVMCGNMNMAVGLVSVIHLALQSDRMADAAKISEGLRACLYAAAKTKPFKPHWMGWLDGDAYILCEMAIRLLGEDKIIRDFQNRFISDSDINVVGKAARNVPYGFAHRFNTTAAMLLASPEYKKALKSKNLSWNPLPLFREIENSQGKENISANIPAADDSGDILLADFEGTHYNGWVATGWAFGTAPARGTLPNQPPVSGYQGNGLVNTFFPSDEAIGTLTSPAFQIERKYINFLLGGWSHPGLGVFSNPSGGKTCIELLVDDQIEYSTTGYYEDGNDALHLTPHTWDVSKFLGKIARIVISELSTGQWGHILIDDIVQSDKPSLKQYANPSITRAMAGLEAAIRIASQDLRRPSYHLLAPAQYMSDVCGPIYYNGWHHVFYQHLPIRDDGRTGVYWGHARSKDLVYWEHLPVAIWPSIELGENYCWSGCSTINGKGQPMIFYTKVWLLWHLPREARPPYEQWAAIGDEDLITWKKHTDNPMVTNYAPNQPLLHKEMRDPFIFKADGRTFMIVGRSGIGTPIFEAQNLEYSKWKYKGLMSKVLQPECPNFFQIGEKWVYLANGSEVKYYIGSFNTENLEFNYTIEGHLEPKKNLYATNVFLDKKGRQILMGWVRSGDRNDDFPGDKGRWAGCHSLPRVFTLGSDGRPRMNPVPELQKLRGKHFGYKYISLDNCAQVLEEVGGDALEIIAEYEIHNCKTVGIKVRRSQDGKKAVAITYDGKILEVAGVKTPLELEDGETLRLHIFLDKSVLEVYANNGRAVITKVIYSCELEDIGVEIYANGGVAKLLSMDIWEMKPIW